jgi:tetratricopeptide (TPR) repeat protein
VPFIADDLGAWLIGLMADAGWKWAKTLVLGTDQQRALRSAAAAAIQLTATEVHADNEESAQHLARVIDQVFHESVPSATAAGETTLLEALQARIAAQLAVLDDADLTAVGEPASAWLGVPGAVLAGLLTDYLLREIRFGGARGGPLAPLAARLDDDTTHLQLRLIDGKVDRLDDKLIALIASFRAGAAAPTALAQLPPVTAAFAGRRGELAVLAEFLDPGGASGSVLAVAGLPGVGKTTLAIEAGRSAQQRGWFAGGVLFVNLHGYDQRPAAPGQALDALLRALGVRSADIPPEAEERAALYRSVLAENPDPVLVIADNASSEGQIRLLLPGAGPHKVLVTSRHTLAGLDARLVEVTVLAEEAGIDLLDKALRAARPEDDRITGDRPAAAHLARLCGLLPLALQITAALLKVNPALTAAALAQELAVESARLRQLTYNDGADAAGLSVTAAFELSYRRLGELPARVFRLLPVNPGPDVSSLAAAVLANVPFEEVQKMLVDLARAHLVEAAPGGAVSVYRWRTHDLLRLYARQLSDTRAEADGQEQARERLLAYYLSYADAADRHLRALPAEAKPNEFENRDQALVWLNYERASLVAAVTMAADAGQGEIAQELADSLAEYLNGQRRFGDWLAVTTTRLDVTLRDGDRPSYAVALNNRGLALYQVREFEEAITSCREAAAIFRETRDLPHLAGALNNLGAVLLEVREFEEAITVCQEAAVIFLEIHDRRGEAGARNSLGAALWQADRFSEAIDANQDAAAIFLEIGDRPGEGGALDNLGLALRAVGQLEEAITAHQAAVAIFLEIGDRPGESRALNNLGLALQEAGRPREAVIAHQEGLAICLDINDRHGQGGALNSLGAALQDLGLFEEAIAAFQNAADIFRETRDRRREGIALDYLEAAKTAQRASI